MLGNSPSNIHQVTNYYNTQVNFRKSQIHGSMFRVTKIVQEILKEVEILEPRFISTLIETNGRFEGVIVHSPHEFEVVLFLNQMGVFNFVDDGSIPGCAVLKLSDGRKRSMSLWVEFITASGYLSARKMRSRFQTLVGQAIEKPEFRDYCKLVPESSDVRLRVEGEFIVQITCAFKCNGIWPRSAAHWPNSSIPWPNHAMASDVKQEGFDLTSKDTIPSGILQNKQANSMEGDAWAMCFSAAENIILTGNRRKALSILKCLRDKHLEFPGTPITAYILKTLVLFECEKHSNDYEWEDVCIADRLIGVLLQLVSCLQCHRCSHYFLPQLDLLRGKPVQLLDEGARKAWRLVRTLMLNSRALETL
ncbi:unnamed protein product, partial [Mesorhabditis belari]|uniref:Uncharacterized protein n=1 Tax=Mesorhabditis belari TaxID=2138241 RepID=A0AAF3EB50_9BILA